MKLNTYQQRAAETITPACRDLNYLIPALASEAGEVAGKYAKVIRGDYDGPKAHAQTFAADMCGELGDVLWMVAMVAQQLGFGLEEVAERNVEKLASRQRRGVIGGNGDNR